MNEKKKSKVPHIGIITLNAVVHKVMPDGNMHPAAVHNESFSIGITEKTEEDCVELLKQKIKEVKEQWENSEKVTTELSTMTMPLQMEDMSDSDVNDAEKS